MVKLFKMADNHRPCFLKRENFCYLCAAYIKRTDLRAIIGLLFTYLLLCYPHERIQVRHSYQATSICPPCRTNITTIGKARKERKRTTTKLRIKELARWKRPDIQHERCFLCKVDVSSSLNLTRHPENIERNPDWSLVPCVYRDEEDEMLEFEPEDYEDLQNLDDIEYDDPDYQPEDESSPSPAPEAAFGMPELNDMVKVLQLDKAKSQLLASIGVASLHGLSVSSFKVCLIFNRPNSQSKKLPVIPVFYSTKFKESYDDLKQVLELLNYENEKWLVCCNFKILDVLCGLKGSFSKYCCIFCLWDSRDRPKHYIKTDWKIRTNYETPNEDEESLSNPALVPINKILLPPLHIKLGVFSQLIKSLVPFQGKRVQRDGNPAAMKFLKEFFPNKTETKIEAGTFTGPQIRKLMKSRQDFGKTLNRLERKCWVSFCNVVDGFFGNARASNYRELIKTMLEDFKENSLLMSPKVHYLHNHLDLFRESCGGFGEEQGENHHQEMKVFEKRYKKNILGMILDYCWSRYLESNYDGRTLKDQSFLKKT